MHPAVQGTPLARHSIDAFRRFSPSPVICLVGYRHERSPPRWATTTSTSGPTTRPAAPPSPPSRRSASRPCWRRTRCSSSPWATASCRPRSSAACGRRTARATREADLTFLTAHYEPPKNRGKGRVLRERERPGPADHRGTRHRRRPDELGPPGPAEPHRGQLPAVRDPRRHAAAGTCEDLTNDNAQGQYYLTDIIEAISREGGDIRTITTTPADPEYDLLCSDVTQPMDLALLEGILASAGGLLFPEEQRGRGSGARDRRRPARRAGRLHRPPAGGTGGRQPREKLAFQPDRPVGIGISGGRLRIAFMHPDMVRFFGPGLADAHRRGRRRPATSRSSCWRRRRTTAASTCSP